MDIQEWPRCIKSARQKRRLVKTDRDKQLIQLNKRLKELWEQKRLLPKVPLAQPYQRGWKRFFVLREDIKQSTKADFYEALLIKINTVEYHHDKSFKRKKRYRGKNRHWVKQQFLREFSDVSWQTRALRLTEKEQACFTKVEFINRQGQLEVKHVVTAPWRYLLKIAPNIITHVKLIDTAIEKELSHINNQIERHHLIPRINRLAYRSSYQRKEKFNEPLRYINRFKNISRYAPKEVYLELET